MAQFCGLDIGAFEALGGPEQARRIAFYRTKILLDSVIAHHRDKK